MNHRAGLGSDSQGTNLRALAPRPTGYVSSQPYSRSPKKNNIACMPCRQAKRKCSGPPPSCLACQNTHNECFFDPSLDQRRKDARKRTGDERDFYRSILAEVLHGLRGEPARADELLDFIRNSPIVDSIITALEHPDFNLNDANSLDTTRFASAEDALLSLCPQQGSHTAGNGQGTPLQVPAKPWTSVTDSDEMVSHLVSLYFTWDHPCLQVLDQTVFLAHMNSDTASMFCTPFLVNCILALATYSDPLPTDAPSDRSRFLTEAENLWKAEEGTASITNVQGLLLMCHILNIQGRATLSWMVLRQAVQLAQGLGMFGTPIVSHPELETPPEMQRVRATTAWAVFTINVDMSLQLQKNANLAPPLVPRHMEDDVGIVWSPYPRGGHASMSAPRYIGTELAKLAGITVSIPSLSFYQKTGMGLDELWGATNEVHPRLVEWYEKLPGIQSHPVPQAVYLHMKYHEATIATFTPFLDSKPDGTSHALHHHARKTRVLAARKIAQHFHMMCQSYGYEQIPSMMLGIANTALRVAVCDLGNGESKEASMELCHVLAAFSKRLKLAKDMIHEVQSFAQQSGLVLPSIFSE